MVNVTMDCIGSSIYSRAVGLMNFRHEVAWFFVILITSTVHEICNKMYMK